MVSQKTEKNFIFFLSFFQFQDTDNAWSATQDQLKKKLR
jgi:hypothetical protein